MSYSRVLVATDLSEHALRAAELARHVAGAGAQFRVLHVEAPPLDVDDVPPSELDARERYAAERRASMDLDLKGFAERAGLRGATVAVRVGGVAREVAAEAAAFNADLVAIGARGQTRWERLLVGSNARGILRRVEQADVLVARAGAAPRRVLVATDFHPPARAAAKRAVDVAKRCGAQLIAFHVLEHGPIAEALRVEEADAPRAESAREAARRRLHDANARLLDGSAIEVLVEGRAPQETSSFASEHGVDLVVVGTHGGGRFERALLGSVAEGIVERVACSALVVRA